MIHVPFIAHFPGCEPETVDQQISWLDMYPTLLEMLEITIEKPVFDGRSIAPLFIGESIDNSVRYYSRAFGDKLKFTLRGSRFKYIHNDGVDLLFDLVEDPDELNNIAASYPALTATLRQRGLLLVAANTARSGGTTEVELTPDEERELKNLGYLQ
jgi:arylsulfatase A-like enzyme